MGTGDAGAGGGCRTVPCLRRRSDGDGCSASRGRRRVVVVSTPGYRHYDGAALCERGRETSPLVRPARLERQKSCRTSRPRAMSQCSLGVRYSSRRAFRRISRIRMRFGSAGRTLQQSWRITPVPRAADRFCHRAWHTGHRASSPEGPVRLGQAPLDNRVHRDALSRIDHSIDEVVFDDNSQSQRHIIAIDSSDNVLDE